MSSTAWRWRWRSAPHAQHRALEILQFKLDVLWSMLDAMTLAYQLDRAPYHSVTDQRVYHRGLS